MKKLRWRLFLHFSFQFISIAVLMVIVILMTLFIVIAFYAKDVSENNYYQAKLESITVDTGISFKQLEMNDGWDESLEEDLWVQIINEDGKVVEAGNVPKDLPNQYSPFELLEMQETEELQDYSLTFYLETFYETPYLFVLGHFDQEKNFLETLAQDYGQKGLIADQHLAEVESKLKNINGSLELVDSNEKVKQRIGVGPKKEQDKPLHLFMRKEQPDVFSTKLTTYQDPDSDLRWVLTTSNENKKEMNFDSYRDLAMAFGITAMIVLLITILISVWNGFRYGNPLFIFANWLSRMGNEQYEEVLTERERKQVFRKNGKTKMRYRLYDEVFQAFYGMAEKLERSKKEREELEKNREEWMTGISHDLRTPLSTMQGYGKLLESGQYEWTKEELEEIGKTLGEKSEYMLSLIEDFSLSFQLKNQETPASFKQVDINPLMEDILSKFQGDLTLRDDYQLRFQPLNQPHYLSADEKWFERMIDNLIYNAIKHNPQGTDIEVVLSKDEPKNEFKILIKDNGIGMDEVTKKHLFTRYYRGTNTDERIEGTGLGMNIAMRIAQLHRGEVSVESEKSQGTTVSIVFPLS
ncbi:sensor histidine kinase [Mesobacillus maritimus]|uniref:histidine kinase n=1 Tax=Mesobacillus maritimus TaxID=1643336 RepID=A0ABS7K0H4_9BACI|nr:HAMP domain-containing sensor histidine kinase [Mesobacillus maritimus]MBY0095656.1 HAMP domain-containing histidine kinase [Mesobacillus maritimus]